MMTGIRSWAHRHPVALYAVLACALSWSWWLPMAWVGTQSRPGIGWPTHLPGLLGPAIAAVIVTALAYGGPGVSEFRSRLFRWRVPWRWWAVVVATVGLAVLGALLLVVSGRAVPPIADFAQYTGIGTIGSAGVVAVALVVNGFGEEAGWRGFAVDHLLRRHGLLATSLRVWVIWGIWHLPMFWVVESFRAMGPVEVVGWSVGLLAGSVVLAWIYRGGGSSIPLVACWHIAFNLSSATLAARGLIAAISSTVVMVWAVVIVIVELRRRK